ncbi:hypothetical protein Q31b_03750 [Novipirellula aureliae]|uniref:Uncharacterized protein n=1 Tax=Novipirellula aureliae TaxID=2527966 RepID=A0A5C6E9A9_9BACT|nr:hypothetical protein Q31b_03750 [Novipirellula aureliae]
MIVLSAVLVSLFVFLFVRIQGAVTGSEFSPDSFSVREFRFYELPIFHLQITPIDRSTVTPSTAIYLRQTALINSPTKTPDLWHLVSMTRGFTGKTPADAELLVDQLNIKIAGGAYWRLWSVDQPAKAKVFWPIIQKLAKREMYIMMPKLFEIAQSERSVDEMTERLDQSLRSQYEGLIRDMRAADQNELADQFFKEMLEDFPNDFPNDSPIEP